MYQNAGIRGDDVLEGEMAGADGETVGEGRIDRSAFGPLDGDERRRLGRFVGVLMIVGAVVSLPAGLALDPPPPLYEHVVALVVCVLGIAALIAPWERLSSNWLHLFMIAGTFEVAAGVAIFSDDYAFFFVLVAMYAAYVIRDRTVLFAYILFFTLALVSPLLYDDEDAREQLHHILVTLPVFLISAAVVRYLRDTLEQREREYRGFAFEAVSLAERIRGHDGAAIAADGDLETRLDRLARGEQSAPHAGD